MTEDTTAQQSHETTPPTRPMDSALLLLVLAANKHGLSTGITLTVKGTVISGTLIGRDQWVEAIRESMRSGAVDEGGAAFVDEWASRFEIAYRRNDDPDWHEEYIHLADASYVVDSSNALHPATWRGRIDAVDGWSWGRFGPPIDDEEDED